MSTQPLISELIAVDPVRTPAPYLGGKRMLSSRLLPIITSIPHRTYVEPFVGMGGIFFRRSARPPVEVINDLSGDVANLFRILQRHYLALMDMLRWQLTSRAEFDRLRALPGERLTDLERAARFLYLQRLAFGGRVESRSFGVDRRTPGRFDVGKLEPLLADVHERLSGVVVEQLPFADVIRRYDARETLFYLDPPYDETEGYGLPFGRAEHRALAEQLAAIAGRFVLSVNDTPFTREVYGRFELIEVDVAWTLGRGKRAGELIVRN